MRHLILGATLLLATPALACPMADKADYEAAAEKVQAAEGTKLVLAVEGMHCGACSEKIVAALTAIDGVVAAAADYQTGETKVAVDASKVKAEALLAAIKGVGFTATVKS